jgi:large repetitive protein
VLQMTLPFLGWTNKLLEVQNARLTVQKRDEHTMTLGTELDLQETDPGIYSWSTSEELGPAGFAQPQTVGTQSITAPQNIALGNASIEGTNFTLGQIAVTWTPSQDGFVANGGSTIVQYSTDQQNWFSLGTYPASTDTAYIPNISGGTAYYARVAFINAGGVQSDWAVEGPITATGSSMSFFYADDETPSGAIDGVNQTFTLANTPTPPASLSLFFNGQLLVQGLDYTLSGATVTLTSYTPANGDDLRAWYRYGGSTGSSSSGGSTGGTGSGTGSGSGTGTGGGTTGGGSTTLTITTQVLPAAARNTPYTVTLTASGGSLPYFWVASGLPTGLSMFNIGTINGTPAVSGTFAVEVFVTDAETPPVNASKTLLLTVS